MALSERAWQPVLNKLISERTRTVVDRDWKNPLRTVRLYDNLMTLFQTLADNKILSCCVVDTDGTYRGFVEMLDLVTFVVDTIGFYSPGPLSETTRQKLLNATVSQLVYRPAKREVHLGASLLHSLEQMVDGDQKYLALVDTYRKPTGILTQSMVIRYLFNNLALMGDSVQSYPLWQIRNYTTVISVRETETAIAAFRLMASRGVNGIAVVDGEDRVLDCISVSDLRGLDPHTPDFWKLFDSVREFKRHIRSIYPFSVPLSAITVRRDDTFRDVLRKMAGQGVHRVFVVSEFNRLLDIITQTDVLDFVVTKLRA
jgi:CBS-domain-containing membrane protein